jgi:hypothetical protein
LTGDGTLSVVYANINNAVRVLSSNVKVFKNSIFSGMYLYTPSHNYKNIEDIKSQKTKIFISLIIVILMFILKFTKKIVDNSKTPGRKVI